MAATLREIACLLLAGLTVSTLLCCGSPQRPLSATDDEIWEDFEQWVERVLQSPAEEHASLQDLFIGYLEEKGLSAEEAQWRMDRIIELRGASTERERVYWNAKHRLGDSPIEPLALVREAAAAAPPGKALDVAMGNGRHAIYLASQGWEATGYDFSPESVRAARALAREAGVTITAVEASHATFDFGEEAWDLIIVTYPYYDTMDSTWPPRLWRALRPGGRVVFQGVADADVTTEDFEQLWQPFDLVRCEILDHGEDWFEGRESRTVKLIAKKE
jgi:SAM-dependent methyltransferase